MKSLQVPDVTELSDVLSPGHARVWEVETFEVHSEQPAFKTQGMHPSRN